MTEDPKPKILTLEIKVQADNSVDLTLDLGDGHLGPRPVRCWDLKKSETKGDLQFLKTGFGHMGEDNLEGEDDQDEVDFDEVDFDENNYEDDIPDDSGGLEGIPRGLG